MRDNAEDYFRKSIPVPFLDYALNEMKTRFTDLHFRTALGLQLVPSTIENIAPYKMYLSPPPPTESLDPPLGNQIVSLTFDSKHFAYTFNGR